MIYFCIYYIIYIYIYIHIQHMLCTYTHAEDMLPLSSCLTVLLIGLDWQRGVTLFFLSPPPIRNFQKLSFIVTEHSQHSSLLLSNFRTVPVACLWAHGPYTSLLTYRSFVFWLPFCLYRQVTPGTPPEIRGFLLLKGWHSDANSFQESSDCWVWNAKVKNNINNRALSSLSWGWSQHFRAKLGRNCYVVVPTQTRVGLCTNWM